MMRKNIMPSCSMTKNSMINAMMKNDKVSQMDVAHDLFIQILDTSKWLTEIAQHGYHDAWCSDIIEYDVMRIHKKNQEIHEGIGHGSGMTVAALALKRKYHGGLDHEDEKHIYHNKKYCDIFNCWYRIMIERTKISRDGQNVIKILDIWVDNDIKILSV